MTNVLHPGPPAVGEGAPDIVMPDGSGGETRLSTLWTATPRALVLVFLRHFGWPLCREQAAQLRRDHGRLTALGGTVVAVGQGSSAEAAAFARALDLPFPVLADPERRGYAAFGLVEGGAGAFLNAATGMGIARALRRGAGGGRVVGNARQLPGAFVIDRTGVVRFAKPARHAADTPSTADLLGALAEVP